MSERSKTVDEALRLLRNVATDGAGSATDLGRRLGINRTSAHRLLNTLNDHGLVRRDADGQWQLGITLLELAAHVEDDMRRVARPLLEELAQRFGETVVLSVPDGNDVVAVDQALGAQHPLRIHYRQGMRHLQTRGAHGRAVLAYADDEHIQRVLEADAKSEDVLERLEQVRRRGYAASHDELQSGASGVAVPVGGRTGGVIASLGVVAPVGRLPDEAEVAEVLRRAAARIVEALDHVATDQRSPGGGSDQPTDGTEQPHLAQTAGRREERERS